MKLTTRRAAIVVGAAVLASVLAGTVVAAQLRGGLPDLEKLDTATATEPMTRIADIPARDGNAAHTFFVQVTSTGHFCLWDTPRGDARHMQGGCNPADDPLAGRMLSISFGYEGGPSPGTVSDARIIGVAAPGVDRVAVLMSDGTRRSVPLHDVRIQGAEYRAFAHRSPRGELRRGIEPTAVVALAADGQELDRQVTGVVR